MNDIRLYNGDCLEVMAGLEEHSVDCVICDLPYGITSNKWDIVIPFDKLWDKQLRINIYENKFKDIQK